LSAKKLRPDPRSLIPEKFSIGDVIEGEVVRYVPYGVFIRVFDDINGLVHLSEISTKNYDNPAEALKLGQVVRAKIILMEPKYRKIGLSIKATFTDGSNIYWGLLLQKLKKLRQRKKLLQKQLLNNHLIIYF
jgi:small subunit ribosomal protein S1